MHINNVKGSIWVVVAYALWGSLNIIIATLLKQGYSSIDLTFVQFFVASIICLPLVKIRGLLTPYPILNLARIIFGVIGILSLYESFRSIGIISTLTINLLRPILTITSSIILFRETLSISKFLSISLGIYGSLLLSIKDGTTISINPNFSYPIICSFCFIGSKLIGSYLGKNGVKSIDLTITSVFFSLVTVLILFTPNYKIIYHSNMNDGILLLSLGLISLSAQFCFWQAYSIAEISYLLPFAGSKILFNFGLAILVFGVSAIPNNKYDLEGIGFIILSIFIMYKYNKNRGNIALVK